MAHNQPTNNQPTSQQLILALRHEKEELHSKVMRLQSDNIIKTKIIENLEVEMARANKEIHELRINIEASRNQNLKLLEKQQQYSNHLKLEDASTHKYQSLNKILTQENQIFKQQIQKLNIEKVTSHKQKQNALNKLLVAETKLQALQMQQKFITATLTQLTSENYQLKSEIQSLNKKILQKSTQSVKVIRQDSNQSTEHLISQFQEKLYQKQMSNSESIQRYETKIAELNLKIAHLQAKLVK